MRAARRTLRLDVGAALGVGMLGAVVLAAVFAPVLVAADPVRVDLTAQFRPPSLTQPMGTDNFGRDVWSRVLHGARLSVGVAAAATAISVAVSLVMGGLAGYLGGRIDTFISRAIDVTLAFPRFVLAITVAGLLGAGLGSVVVAIVLVSWAWYARVIRGLVLQARQEQYVQAAEALGAALPRLMLRHLLPAVGGQVVVLASLDFGRIILTISALSFLGLGVRPPVPEWGAMLTEARLFFARNPGLMIFPGLAIFVAVFGANLLGDWLRDVLDPRSYARQRRASGPAPREWEVT